MPVVDHRQQAADSRQDGGSRSARLLATKPTARNPKILPRTNRESLRPAVLPCMKTRKKKPVAEQVLTTNSGQKTHTPRKRRPSKDQNAVCARIRSKAKDRRRASALLLTLTYTECLRAVLAQYPDSIFEWPAERCSISAYPGGPEISRRFTSARPAWIDAAKRVIMEIGVTATRKAIRKAAFLRAKRLELGDLWIAA